MGSQILRLAFQDHTFRVVGALERSGHPDLGKDIGALLGLGTKEIVVSSETEKILEKTDILVEFSSPRATLNHLRVVEKLKKAMVIGTTGLSPDETKAIEEASKTSPILLSPNMSVGVNLLFSLVSEAARRLGKEYEVEIIDTHHRHKKDAPSGTAKHLADLVASARGDGSNIGVHSLRIGDVVGDHTVIFATLGERIEFTHRASSRETFALGALRAAQFLSGKPPRLYTMQDVLKDKG